MESIEQSSRIKWNSRGEYRVLSTGVSNREPLPKIYAIPFTLSLSPSNPDQPKEALDVDLGRIQTAGLWTNLPVDDWSTTSTSDSIDDNSDKTVAGRERDEGDISPVPIRSTITRPGTAELLKIMVDASSSSAASGSSTTPGLHRDAPTMQQPTDIGNLPMLPTETGDTENYAAKTHPEAPLSQMIATAEEVENIEKKPEEEITSDDQKKSCNRRREAWNRKFLNVLVKQGEKAKAEMEALKQEVSKVNEDKLHIITSGKEYTKALVQARNQQNASRS